MQFLLKICFSGAILYWLIHTDRLNFRELDVFFTQPRTLAMFLFYWLFANLILSSFRWMILARALGINLKTIVFLRLHLIGCFFNSFMPGNVGGDFVKVYYIANKEKKSTFSNALASVLFDRVCGLIGIFLIAIVGFYVAPPDRNAGIDAVLSLTQFLSSASIIGIIALFVLGPKIKLHKWPWNLPIFRRFRIDELFRAGYIYSQQKVVVLSAIGISVIIQLMTMSFFLIATKAYTANVTFIQICAAYPLAALATAIPIAPAGLGTGHYAHERLFDIVGIGPGIGANVFNLYFCASLAFSLIGIIPYLLYKKSIAEALRQAKDHAHS